MKRNRSKLLAFLLTLALILSMTLPALAYEDTDPPLWELMGYDSLEQLLAEGWLTEEEYAQMIQEQLDYQASVQSWLDAHPQEAASFDPYAYYEETYASWYEGSAEDYMAQWNLTEEAFCREMRNSWVGDVLAYEALLQEQAQRQAWLDAHPQEVAAFDPYAYYDEYYAYLCEPLSAQEYMESQNLTEEEFRQEMLSGWAQDQMEQEEFQREMQARRQTWLDAHPQEAAAFDPYVYYQESYFLWFELSAEDYMAEWDMTEEEFRQEMLDSWVDDQLWQEEVREALAQEKELAGGTPDGVNVMLDGSCVPFPDARPFLEDGRAMIPVAPVMEYLGADVEYIDREYAVSIAMEDPSLYVYHKIGTREMTLSHTRPGSSSAEDGTQTVITLDVPSYAKDGRTMVSPDFFSKVLGYQVYWDDSYETSVLLNGQALADRIDPEFTLLNRLLYTLSGTEFRQDGTALDYRLDVEMAVTPAEAAKPQSIRLSGSALVSDQAVQLNLTMDLSAFRVDYVAQAPVPDDSTLALETFLSNLELEVILSQEDQMAYFRGPALTALAVTTDPSIWVSLPIEGLELSQLLPMENPTLGHLLIGQDAAYVDAFHLYQDILSTSSTLQAVLGDDCFTRSGSSYTLNWDAEELGMADPIGETDFSTNLTITPQGDRGCSFSAALTSRDAYSSLDLDWRGSSGTSSLTMKGSSLDGESYRLEADWTIQASSRLPIVRPLQGDTVIDGTALPEDPAA